MRLLSAHEGDEGEKYAAETFAGDESGREESAGGIGGGRGASAVCKVAGATAHEYRSVHPDRQVDAYRARHDRHAADRKHHRDGGADAESSLAPIEPARISVKARPIPESKRGGRRKARGRRSGRGDGNLTIADPP